MSRVGNSGKQKLEFPVNFFTKNKKPGKKSLKNTIKNILSVKKPGKSSIFPEKNPEKWKNQKKFTGRIFGKKTQFPVKN